MQQRQLRLGDILDDYCPRERRLTNHAVVAMVGPDVKQTRCTTCDAEHEYKHAKVPRQRKKSETPAALTAQVLAGGPKKVTHDSEPATEVDASDLDAQEQHEEPALIEPAAADESQAVSVDQAGRTADEDTDADVDDDGPVEEGPVHRPLIRAQLPRQEGQPPPVRPAPDFTIRQPGGRNRFRPRHDRGGGFQGNRSNGHGNVGGGPMRSGGPRPTGGRPPLQNSGRPPMMSRLAKRQGSGRKRSK
jgi:hypothetical protein